MAGRTRSGARFSPHELFNIVIPMQSIVDEDMHAACLDEGCMHDDDDDAASSPLSSPPDSPVNSRPHSPIPSASAPHSSPSPPSAPPHSPIPSVSVPAPHPSPSPPSAHPAPPPPANIECHRRNQAAAKRRGKRRQKARDDQMPYDRKVDPRYPQSHRQQPPHTVPIDIAAAPAAARDAWIGRRSKKPSGCIRTLPELKDKGGKVIEWNGRDPKLIVDKEGRIIAILLGTPEDPDWPN
ncbi:hypothetical protein B0H14DRAFT_2780736, partial [Mycena olivaceomarginata]